VFGVMAGWVQGYLSAYNRMAENGKSSVTSLMSVNDIMRWMSAYCRDNPSMDIYAGTEELIRKLEK
jgi:hypothetical protein